ncbi:MAG: YkgJ family cysteine cluster protein [Kiritimatiellales bacterium]|nr:YkgJ family cysteine cluster protein [Kiritimatiellales bacterium]
MAIVTDLQLITKLASEREDENWRFRTFLKGYDIEELDAVVHRIYADVSSQIDCQACGNCCRVMHPILKQPDMIRLSSHLSISQDDFDKEYLIKDEDGDLTFRETPCPFLSDNSCSVYQGRPNDCRSYPHLHKKEFVFRLMGVVYNYSVCPIVFNVYEQLKDELWGEDEEYFFDDYE